MRSIAAAVAVASVLLAVAGGSVVTNRDDEHVLHVVAAALGPAGRSLNWDNCTRPCQDWEGVSCNANGSVVGISARGAGFNGTLLEDAHYLRELHHLDLRDNDITGPLPDVPFLNLKTLHLDCNAFTAVPAGLSAEREAASPTSTRSKPTTPPITGTLSAFLRNGTAYANLVHVSLARNRLTGPVPATFVSKKLEHLDLSDNLLTGTIDFVINFPNIKILRLDGNSFAGQLPDFQRLKKLEILLLGQNQLTGLVPPSLMQLPNLAAVTLADNLFQGPLPEPGPCADDVVLLLSVAAGFEFPASLAASWKGNSPCAGWMGVHCDKTGATITGINLCRHGLNGTIHPAIGGLRSLRAVLLSGNNLGGAVPATISRLADLLLLDVSDNQINGSIPRLPRGAVVWADQGNTAVALSSPPASLPTATIFFVLATFCYSLS
ncbi:hypothetical protein QOZ80_3BG0265630 [Eleusine coracana subsp. coracana]|nr:hypothetical protein QOZ80_3BG0265630 [Eleusine coracana subsp. coracana]